MKPFTDTTIFSIFEQYSIKNTHPRRVLLVALLSAMRPLTVDELAKKTQKDGINEVTVYRTLNTFVEKGIVRQIFLDGRGAYYEYEDKDKHHHHLVCTHCRKVVDVAYCPLPSFKKHTGNTFNSIENHTLEMFGTCKPCARTR